MKKILVLYFTQSGQLKDILNHLTKDISNDCIIDFKEIKPNKPFPFPWSAAEFFDVMPESVLRIPIEIEPMPQLNNQDYDLVILGYQPWFLFPSQPTTGFLKSEWAKVLTNKPVITVLGTRNMWLNAQECVKEELNRLKAKLVGNIVFEDKHSNLTSTLTIIRWLLKGKKEASGRLPAAGVSDYDILQASIFGQPIAQCLMQDKLQDLQQGLLKLNSLNLHPNLITLEKRGLAQFPKFAKRAIVKGGPGAAARKPIIKTFQNLLIVAIFILSPITSVAAKIKTALNKKTLMKEVDYFKGVDYEVGKFK